MREYSGMYELRPSICGEMASAASATAIGAPVDTMGFADVLAILTMGGVAGTEANSNTVSVKIQESSSPTTIGTTWTDIGDGAISGTFAIASQLIASTNPLLYMGKKYERLSDGKRKRYIRAHATIVGTAGTTVKISAAFLLGRPIDTLYINNAVSAASGNSEFSQLK